MSFLAQASAKRVLALHGWSGTLLGLLLYVVIITGTISVFAAELGQWAAGREQAAAPLAPPLDSRLRELASSVDTKYQEELFVYPMSDGAISAFFHAHVEKDSGQVAEKGVRFMLAPDDGSVLQRDEGFADELPDYAPSALAHFITELHINLHAPQPWGLFATGLLGLSMLIAVISGILLHKHLIKELLVNPRKNNFLLNRRDRHVLAGTWSLPFGFLLAFTGTFYSFAGSVTLPVVAYVAFGGDQEKMIEALIASDLADSDTPAEIGNLDAMIADSMARSGAAPSYLFIQKWGRQDALVQIQNNVDEEKLTGQLHRYAGATGEHLGLKPLVGNEPSIGNTVLALVAPLHFGNFAGLLSKIVWFSLGIAMCYVTLTGLQLWTARRADDPTWAWLERGVMVVGYGTGIAMAGAGIGFFPGLINGEASAYTSYGFLGSGAFAVLLGLVVRDREKLAQALRLALGVALILLPVTRILTGGDGWASLFEQRSLLIVGMDIALLTGGALALATMRRPTVVAVNAGKTASTEALGATG
ncbi:MAG: PepSY-associated TM helix domain-containing protein [Pseudomonadota bacterium]